MSSLAHPIVFLSLFLLSLHPTISVDILSPLFSPIIDELCKAPICGKGKCKVSVDYNFGYMCECDQGWKQSPSSEQDLDDLRFLPCVIPNCTVDYNCTKAATPSPQIKDAPKNTSFFDPCSWTYCGEGTCKKANTSGHECVCQEGSVNLFNSTEFPCYNECSLGMDCANLGLTLSNNSVSPPTSGLTDSHACSVLPSKIFWMVILMLSIAMLPWK